MTLICDIYKIDKLNRFSYVAIDFLGILIFCIADSIHTQLFETKLHSVNNRCNKYMVLYLNRKRCVFFKENKIPHMR